MYLFLARYLGPDRFGQYAIALTYVMFFGFLADLGFDSVLIRDISRHPEQARDYFGHSLFVKLCSGAITFLVAAAVVTLMGYPKDTLGVILVGLAVLFIAPAIGAMDSLFKGLQQMVYSSVLQISRNLLTFVLIMVLIFNKSNIRSIVAVHPVVAIFVFLISYVFIVKRKLITDMRLNLDTALLKSIFREAIPFFMLGAIYTVNSKIHILMLSKLGGIRDVGLFNAVNEIINFFWVLPILVSTVMFPVMSRQFIDSREELAKTSRHVNRILATIGIPLGWGIIVLAPNILGFLYGSKYAESVPSFRLLAISLSVGIPLGVNGWLLAAMDKVQTVMWIQFGMPPSWRRTQHLSHAALRDPRRGHLHGDRLFSCSTSRPRLSFTGCFPD